MPATESPKAIMIKTATASEIISPIICRLMVFSPDVLGFAGSVDPIEGP